MIERKLMMIKYWDALTKQKNRTIVCKTMPSFVLRLF